MRTSAGMTKRIAAPMIGGVCTSFIVELLVYPPIYSIWKWRYEMKGGTVDVSKLPIPRIGRHYWEKEGKVIMQVSYKNKKRMVLTENRLQKIKR